MSPETTFLEIHKDFYATELGKNPRRFISIYEDHIRQIEDIKPETVSADTYQKWVQIQVDYAHMLFQLSEYSKALPASKQAIEAFTKHPQYNPQQVKEIYFYEVLLFQRAAAHFHLGHTKTAKALFKELVEMYPQSNTYRSWLQTLDMDKINTWSNIFTYTGCIGLLVVVLIDVFTEGPLGWWYDVLLGILVLTVIGMGATEWLKIKARKALKRSMNQG